ncbi:endonuclease domain-containing protein [Actinobacillus equuli]|uniref:endonuclease domain-containing protein n=1 Tax=Actinobacillus equuli TaxID=718 RepID=UPI0024436766|nr:endonuclease domain-containing protein [Actinobacillus equuli]WGE84562.1 endonuclease domain-containing protein [Actinobacillus equuli subsp. equuli]WGE88572.1 endonuclease domain-containing protein [Actinobacillus equuli subsp. haemolyticus]
MKSDRFSSLCLRILNESFGCLSPVNGREENLVSETNMREKETKQLRQNAKNLRSNMTEAEWALWYHLRAKRFCGVKFYRQKIVGNYIADFLSLNSKLIIELDGSQHAEQMEYDRIRTAYLEEQNFTVIRFWNDEVLKNIDMVLDVIFDVIHQNSPSPSENP